MTALLAKIRCRLRRGLWRILTGMAPGRVSLFQLDSTGQLQLRYPLKSGIGKALFVGGFESAELQFVQQRVRSGDVVLDVGANGGIYSLIVSRLVGPTGRVIAFEPGQNEQQLLRSNLALNGINNVTVVASAVSDRTGIARLAVASDGALNSLAATGHHEQVITSWQETDTIRIDDYLEREKIDRVDFVKVDVEGAESLVFDGASRLLTRARSLVILFEAFDANAQGFGRTTSDLLEKLRCAGFKLSYFDPAGRLCALNAVQPEFGVEIYNFVAERGT